MSVDTAFRGVTDSCKIYIRNNGPLTDYSRDAINLREMQDFEYDDGVTARHLDIRSKYCSAVAFPARASVFSEDLYKRSFLSFSFFITHS